MGVCNFAALIKLKFVKYRSFAIILKLNSLSHHVINLDLTLDLIFLLLMNCLVLYDSRPLNPDYGCWSLECTCQLQLANITHN